MIDQEEEEKYLMLYEKADRLADELKEEKALAEMGVTEDRSQIAHDITNDILEKFNHLEEDTHQMYTAIGQLLISMRDGKRYKDLGYKNMNEYVRELGKSRAICYNMMDYYQYLSGLISARPELKKYPVSYLCREIVPMLKGYEAKPDTGAIDIDELVKKLVDIADLPDSERADEVRGLKGKRKHVDCTHEELETWYRCKGCGKFIKKV